MPHTPDNPPQSRRSFIKTTAAASAAVWPSAALASGARAAGSDEVKVGLIGAGGRGRGAASQALTAEPYAKLVAIADAFADRTEDATSMLKQQVSEESGEGIGNRVAVEPENQFAGFDAYKKVIDMSDVVILTSTPHFRPRHLRAAVEAGKHVFCEKPVAVDPVGIRSVLESTKLARKNGTSLVSGLCWRYHPVIRATFQQLHDGLVGDITAMECTYNTGGVWDPRKTRQQCASDMEYQIRNWYYYTWLSGDFNAEQHVHSLDKMQWAMHDVPPETIRGSGGRTVRTQEKYGNIYDHFNVIYEYANGVKAFSSCRHWRNSANEVSDRIFCTEGTVEINSAKTKIVNRKGDTVWKYEPKKGEETNMYQVEHNELFQAIRDNKPINNGKYMSLSTMMAISGRMATYTGKKLTWDQCMNSKLDLTPENYEFGEAPEVKIAVPGKTKFI
jgi:predicted dehydrogenase